jgi:hypothetical protein
MPSVVVALADPPHANICGERLQRLCDDHQPTFSRACVSGTGVPAAANTAVTPASPPAAGRNDACQQFAKRQRRPFGTSPFIVGLSRQVVHSRTERPAVSENLVQAAVNDGGLPR